MKVGVYEVTNEDEDEDEDEVEDEDEDEDVRKLRFWGGGGEEDLACMW